MDKDKRRILVTVDQDDRKDNKRHKHDSENHQVILSREAPGSKKTLSYKDYTVGWICALWLEVTAARAMLDEEHAMLPNPSNDNNVYTLGSISGHNVVIACLPLGVYGTTSATVAGLNMKATFPNSIVMPLMVGIGGGVPSDIHDIRLGDIVVSTPTADFPAVKQYDYGKTTSKGVIDIKGTLNKPVSVLLNAVSKLRSQHALSASRIKEYVSDAIARYSLTDFKHPGLDNDVLYGTQCQHKEPGLDCGDPCRVPRILQRSPRQSTNPFVHYGTIASGNQVIKDQSTRDQLAHQHGIICFEMEAAGLMDELRCLVVRGVSDYCDAQKHKEFQGYAALCAAAYVKELLSVVPPWKLESSQNSNEAMRYPDRRGIMEQSLTFDGLQLSQHRMDLMKALSFDEATIRRATVKTAHSTTCRWFLDKSEYLDWNGSGERTNHRGLLWIKGKPGTGKSTIMKFVLEHHERCKEADDIIISFFFNARGNRLEKSVEGMYRSLLFQLLSQKPELQASLDSINLGVQFNVANIDHLSTLFKEVVLDAGRTSLSCFVDALDECIEEEARAMIRFFSDIGRIATDSGLDLKILFSSRHYPHISIDHGLELVLENEDGHDVDLRNYINSELRIESSLQAQNIKEDIFNKSKRLFLWVVLVVQILNREDDRGRVHIMQQRLDEIPLELNELFRDILLKDQHNLAELALCLQWILYARRQLIREELYFALLSGQETSTNERWDKELTTKRTMEKYILDCSKGLVEFTRSEPPYVQFIHESVREFLLKPDALSEVWENPDCLTAGVSHVALRDCCRSYLNRAKLEQILPWQLDPAHTVAAADWRRLAKHSFPFLSYAVENLLHHSDTVAFIDRDSQVEFFNCFTEEFARLWVKAHDALAPSTLSRYLHNDIGKILWQEDLRGLLSIWILQNNDQAYIRQILIPCLKTRTLSDFEKLISVTHHQPHVSATFDVQLLKILHDLFLSPRFFTFYINNPGKRANMIAQNYVKNVWRGEIEKNMIWSCFKKLIAVAAGDRKQTQLNQALFFAVEFGHQEACEYLLMLGADVKSKFEIKVNMLTGDTIWDPGHPILVSRESVLHVISKPAGGASLYHDEYLMRKRCFHFLLSIGAPVNDLDFQNRSALIATISWAGEEEVAALLHHGAFICLGDPLHEAVRYNKCELVRLLLEHGMNVDATDSSGWTPLHLAACNGFSRMIDLLLEVGSAIDTQDNFGRTPLYVAIGADHINAAQIFLENGADINLKDDDGKNMLIPAILRRSSEMVKLLLKYASKDTVSDPQALHLAMENRMVDIVELLIESGARIIPST